MKKTVLLLAACLLVMLMISSPVVIGKGSKQIIGENNLSSINLKVEGACNEQVCGEGYLINGVSYVPIRLIAETLGAEVKWDEVTKTVYVRSVEEQDQQSDNIGFEQALYILGLELDEEIQLITNFNEQLSLMIELHKVSGENQLSGQLNGKLNERKQALQKITDLTIEYQKLYEEKNEVFSRCFDIIEVLRSIIDQYHLSLNTYNNYISTNNMNELKNSLLYRKNAQDLMEIVIKETSELKRNIIL